MAAEDMLEICGLRGDLGDRVANSDSRGGGGVIEGRRRDEKLR
jgi:hypothetical protein